MGRHRRRVAGIYCRNQDSQLLAEISYLDSSSDYREYLPQESVCGAAATQADLVLLDTARRSFRVGPPITAKLAIGMVLLLAAACLLYSLFQTI